MQLYIDTSTNEYINLALLSEGSIIAENKVEAKFKQSEKLLPAIHDLLKANKIDIGQIKKIKVNDEGEGFSSLRIGIVTANALAYALKIPCESLNDKEIRTKKFSLVKPNYNQEPNIG